MKPQFTIAFLLLLISSSLIGQQGVEFKVKIQPNNTSFQVLLRPNFTANNVIVSGTQVTLRVPLGGFEIGTITNHNGTWNSSPSYEDTDTGFEYFFLAPSGTISGINMEAGVELPLFTFENAGACTGPMELIDNENDPVVNSPNPPSIILVNYFSMFGGGIAGEVYLGNYNAISADCDVSVVCNDGNTIDVTDVIHTPPSTCFASDGSIEIEATATGEGTLGPLQYGIMENNGPLIWQNDPVFSGLNSGNIIKLFVRHVGGCDYAIPEQQLEAPFKPIITNITDTPPDCGMDNGTITIDAYSVQGNTLEYAAGNPPTYQSSSTLEDLAAGLISLWVRDPITDCETNVPGYLLEDCVNVPCSNLDLENLGNGLYQVSLTAGETINAPNNVTQSLRVTLKVPTGGFNLTSLTSQVTNVDFTVGATTTAPVSSPGFDYISILLDTPNTSDIPYFNATKIPLFTFENDGTCEGDSVYLIPMDDPYLMTGADVNHEISLGGSVMINECIGEGAVECDAVPSDCDVTFEIDQLPTGEYRISVRTENESVSGSGALTGSATFTFKVPTGGFEISNLTSLINDNFESNLIVASPTEDPQFDYYIIRQLGSTGPTNSPTYPQGQYVPLLTFQNVGPCVSGDIILVDNDDPVAQAVAAGNNLSFGQFISILQIGFTIPACLSSNASVECQGDPCASLSPGFQVGLACEGANIDFTNTTTSNETIASWEWTFGDGSPMSDIESPSHTFSNSGNFEVSLTVTTDSGCEATYSEFVTVFPSPGVPTETAYTDCGSGVEITVPNASSITWTPEEGLLPAPPTDQSTVTAHPTATTVYTVTLTTDDGCSTQTDITVVVDAKPDWKSADPFDISDCGLQDGSIHATATGLGDVEYSLDPNGPWTLDSIFTGLAAGDYNVFARNAGGNCPVAYPFNPVTIFEPTPFTIDGTVPVHPTACSNNGSITVNTTGGDAPLQYTLVGVAGPQDSNVFSDLAEGDYTIEVTNFDGSCLQTTTASLVDASDNPMVTDRIFDGEICVDATGNVSISIDEAIQDVSISGGVFSNQTINGNTVTFDVEPAMGSNNYTVEFRTTSGCSVTDVINITGTAAPTVDFSVPASLCTSGDITFSFTGTASANATFQWSAGGNATPGFDDGNGVAQFSWSSAGSKNVTLTVTDNGCEVSTTNSINITDFDPGVSLDETNPSCGGAGNDGAIDLSVTGGGDYSFNWSGPGIGNPSDEDQTNLPGGTYLVTVTDNNSGCEATYNSVLEIPTGISISASSEDATDCIGNVADGSVTVMVSGGNSNFTYELFDIDNDLLATNSSQNSSFTFDDLSAGAYSVSVTDANGCTDIGTVAVQSVNGGITTSSNFEHADCTGQNGSVSVTVESGDAPYSYQFYSNNDDPVTGDVNGSALDIGGVASGSATVIITDANGCMDVTSFAIGQNPPDWEEDVTYLITQPSCESENGRIELQDFPNGSIPSWPDCPPCSDFERDNLGEGIYTVIIFDANGCQAELEIPVTSTDGPDIEIVALEDATCGNDDGGIVFQVNGGNSFEYRIIGTDVIEGQGTPDVAIPINDLRAGNWTIEVTDLVNPDCGNIAVTELAGGFDVGDTDITKTLPSECGVHDATIEISVDFPNMLSLSTDQGNAPDEFMFDVIITNLYEGDVNITLTDELTGCSEDLVVPLPPQEEPQINDDDFELTHLTCPTDFGSIKSNIADEFFIVDTAGNIKTTPWNDAPKGTYMLKLQDGQCVDSIEVMIEGPDAWEVSAIVEDESCEGEDGSISLEVSGGTSGYNFNWTGDISTSSTAENLSAGDYEVTITDASNCSIVVDEFVDAPGLSSCDCDFIFSIDTIYETLDGDVNEICIPTELNIPRFSEYNFILDGTPYPTASLMQCADMAIYYDYSSLIVGDDPSYRIEAWYGPADNSISGFEFISIEELVLKMREIHPIGNWIHDASDNLILGNDPNGEFGEIVITNVTEGSSQSFGLSSLNNPSPSIEVNDDRIHMLIAIDPLNPDCSDTLYINLLEEAPPTGDTLVIEVPIGETVDTCLDLSQLSGIPETLTNDCVSITNNAQWLATGSECFEVEGISEGTDELCLVLCDDNGNCDTTHVIVTITGDGDLVIFNGFSPNNDNKNDYFRIQNIENYPNNHITIFNRWGNRVYKQDSYKNSNPWRGNHGNTVLPDGSYFYMLEVEIDGKMEMRKGYVQVRR